jgi:diguanylate cyclase (GGDEF)-like protein
MVAMLRAHSKRILVVEDDPMTLEVIVEALVQADFSVQYSSNPQEALQIIEDWEPHLVLTDHDMPGMSGMDLLKQLRARDNYVTVIFVSGRKDVKIKVSALEEGADDFVDKPFRIEELIARVRVCLRNNDIHRELKDKNEQLEKMVDIDDLTGLYNMRTIYDRIDTELARASRQDHNVAVIMMDMDRFKSVNDDNDHLFGSFVLQEVGKIIKNAIRDYDFAARYGGDEFLICLNNIEVSAAKGFCERLRSLIGNHEFRDGNSSMYLTCSLGVAVAKPSTQIDARDLVREADYALYDAKDAGRDRSVVRELNASDAKRTTAS